MNVFSVPDEATDTSLVPRTVSNVAEMVALPTPTAVTRPAVTVATDGADELQVASVVTFLVCPLESDAVAVNCERPPSVGAAPVTETPVTDGIDGPDGFESPHALGMSTMPARAARAAGSLTSLAYDPACPFSNACYPFRSGAASEASSERGAFFLHSRQWTRARRSVASGGFEVPMRMRLSATGLMLATLLWSNSAMAQQKHVADVSDVRQAIASQVQADQSNRATLVRVLQHRQVRDAAARMGVDLDRAERAIPTLSSAELATLAASARNVERDLAGGDVVVIGVTTLLLILILVVLLVKL
jgi:hypothetical protein